MLMILNHGCGKVGGMEVTCYYPQTKRQTDERTNKQHACVSQIRTCAYVASLGLSKLCRIDESLCIPFNACLRTETLSVPNISTISPLAKLPGLGACGKFVKHMFWPGCPALCRIKQQISTDPAIEACSLGSDSSWKL